MSERSDWNVWSEIMKSEAKFDGEIQKKIKGEDRAATIY